MTPKPSDVKAELLPHEFTGPIVNGQHICKWCSGTPNECSYVFGPYCDKRPQPSPKVDGLWPDELTPELADILGRPCFMFIKLSQIARAAGHTIETQAEAEQAFFLHRLLGHWFAHGEAGWRDAASADLRDMSERAVAAAKAKIAPVQS